jgi:hypothetical protein
MQDGLLREVEHFRDVFEVPGGALYARLDLFVLVHDGQHGLHRRVVHEVHLVTHQDHGSVVLLAERPMKAQDSTKVKYLQYVLYQSRF